MDKTILAPLHRERNLGGRIGVNRGRVAAQDGCSFKPSGGYFEETDLRLGVKPGAGGGSQDRFDGGVAGGDLKEDGHI